MNKKQLLQLNTVLSNIERSYNYIQKSMGIAIKINENNSNGADYKIVNEAAIESSSNTTRFVRVMDKNIGSDIAGLSMGLSQLKNFLDSNN